MKGSGWLVALMLTALAGCGGSRAHSAALANASQSPGVAATRASSRHAHRRVLRHTATPPPAVGLRNWSLSRLIGQKLIVAFRGRTLPPAALLARVRRGEVGGVILFSENVPLTGAAGVAQSTRVLQRAAREGDNPPLIVATDQEGGPVKRLPGPPWMSAAQLGEQPLSRIRRSGYETGRSLLRMGVNVDLAPVSDVPVRRGDSFLGERAFGQAPAVVAAAADTFALGLQSAGVAATAKHYPGLGSAAEADTDKGLVVLSTPLAQLRRERAPFELQERTGTRLIMVSNAVYRAYDAAHPAVLSPKIVGGLRRDGFTGVLISDDLDVPEIAARGSAAPREASTAGVDLLLYSDEGAAAFQALLDAARTAMLPRALLEAQVVHILKLKRWLDAGGALQ